jgi:hypothetical protein
MNIRFPNIILIWPKELIFNYFTRSEVENIITEIKEYTVHLIQCVLNFDSFNYVFDRQAYVIYNYMISLILVDNRLRSFSNNVPEYCSKVTVSFRPSLGKQFLLCRHFQYL